jgi:hypothetical protein
MLLVAPGVYRRRGALPRPPDRVQVVEDDALATARDLWLMQHRQARARMK